jgi:D-alanyl-D-alanine carboxypeptidase
LGCLVLLKKFLRLFLYVLFVSLSMICPSKAATDKRAEIVIDVETGRILHNYKSDHIRHPASLTKLMTLYLMFESMDTGRFTPESKVIFSRFAANKPPSKLGIRVGGSITMRDAAYTLIIRSANDVAAAVGETISGSESNFAKLMTQKAKKLGMNRTVFHNASGLPDVRQVTTAKDMAILGLRLMQHYPHYYKYFSTLNKTVAGIPLRTHNHLLKSYKGMDGMKTGFVNMSGFNLVSSAQRNNKRLITVVMGGASYRLRDNRVVALMNLGWQRLKTPQQYNQFIGMSVTQLATLKTPYRPLESKNNRTIMMAIQKNQANTFSADNIKRISPQMKTNTLVQYNLKDIATTKNWRQVPETLSPVPENDEIANLIEKSQTKNLVKNQQARFEPVPVEKALLYKAPPSLPHKKLSEEEQILQFAQDMAFDTHDVINRNKENSTIQVGAFSKKHAADNYLSELIRKYDKFSKAQPMLTTVRRGNDYIYRAKLTGLSKNEAQEACSLLKRMGRYCVMTDNL